MASNNPVLKSLPGVDSQSNSATAPNPGYHGAYGYGDQQYGTVNSGTSEAERPMTVDDIVSKTGITLAVIIAFAVINFGVFVAVSPAIGALLTIVGGVGGFITVLVHSFGKKFGSPVTTLIYAAFEGLFVGGFSFLISGRFSISGADAGALILQAVLGTIGVFIGMLVVYRTGAIRVTARFNRILTGAIFGVAIMALGNLIMSFFFGINALRGGGTLSIIFGLVCVVLAAFAFLQDFDLADKLVRTGAPAKMAWGVALGLAVTLVWLYTEILRLLSYFQQR